MHTGSTDDTGDVVSAKVMVWTPLALFPQSSVAVQVLSIFPSAKHPTAEATSEEVGVTELSQVSEAVANPVAAGAAELPHSRLVSAGRVTTGRVVSTMVRV
jgi:hypothetical protein